MIRLLGVLYNKLGLSTAAGLKARSGRSIMRP